MKKITIPLLLLVLTAACHKSDTSNNQAQPVSSVYLDLSDTAGGYFIGSYPDIVDKKAILGRVLFYDKHLSLSNAVACGSCHKQTNAFADDVPFSRGFEGRLTTRNAPPIQNLMMHASAVSLSHPSSNNFDVTGGLFWDAREINLKTMVLRPVGNHIEMGMTDMNQLPVKLNRLDYYRRLAIDAYRSDTLTLDMISEALCCFMFSIKSTNTRSDKHANEFTAQEYMGRNLFNTKYNCASCHVPSVSYFPDQTVGSIGLDEVSKDKGKGAFTPGMDGVFRIPNLRNVALTAPYMHDGRFATLSDVLEHYSSGIKDHPMLDKRLKDKDGRPMRMNISDQDRQALIAYLKTFTDYEMITEAKYSDPFKTH